MPSHNTRRARTQGFANLGHPATYGQSLKGQALSPAKKRNHDIGHKALISAEVRKKSAEDYEKMLKARGLSTRGAILRFNLHGR